MSIYERENEYIRILTEREYTVKELANLLFVSEPTVRRDVTELLKKDLITRKRGVIKLKTGSPNELVPMFLRDTENIEEKQGIAAKAVKLIKDGDAIMLDASTTVQCLVPYLREFKNIFVITSGAKTALTLANMGIRTLCTGGEMVTRSFSYAGPDAERTLSLYNADIAFISCRGITEDGIATDSSITENSMRKIMMKNSKRTYLLCDSSKVGKRYLNVLCEKNDVTEVIM